MSYRSSHNNADISPTKVRPITKLIARQSVQSAFEFLRHMPNRGARYVEKVLKAAVAGAEEKGAKGAESMVVVEARVDEGPRLKRIRPRARGMAYPILKRLCHIHIEIA
jgi:large subunit ribosomal protein L22